MGQECCAATGDSDTESNNTQYKQSTNGADSNKSSRILQWTDNGLINIYKNDYFYRPLLNIEANEILFIGSHDENIVVASYDLEEQEYQYYSEIEIKQDQGSNEYIEFSAKWMECELDTKSQCIYFLNHDDRIIKLDLEDLDEDESPENLNNDISYAVRLNKYKTINKNHAQIISGPNNKLYILGARASSEHKEPENMNRANIVYIPYHTQARKFGTRSSLVNVKMRNKDYIYFVGSEEKIELQKSNRSDALRPGDKLWIYCINDNNWEFKYLFNALNSFGCINYENKYLFIFGGYRYNKKLKQFKKSSYINYLDLSKGIWYLLPIRLPQENAYYAVYHDDGGDIHLIDYEGSHFIVSMRDILESMNNGSSKLNDWNNRPKLNMSGKFNTTQRMTDCQMMSEQFDIGKTQTPTKHNMRIKRRGPRNRKRKRKGRKRKREKPQRQSSKGGYNAINNNNEDARKSLSYHKNLSYKDAGLI